MWDRRPLQRPRCGLWVASLAAGVLGMAVTATLGGDAAPATTTPAPAAKATTKPTTRRFGRYVPNVHDAPAQREGGGTRQCNAEPGLYVLALAPANVVGKTTRQQPTLLWYISRPTNSEVEITITALEAPAGAAGQSKGKLVGDWRLKHGVTLAGIQKLDLAAGADARGQQVHLDRAVTYEWGVEVLVRPGGEDAADDPSSVVKLQPVAPPPAVARAASSGDPEELTQAYLDDGIWCDALSSITALLENAPGDPNLLEVRRKMLADAGYVEDADGHIEDGGKPAGK